MYHCTTFGQNHQIILFFARHRKVRAALLMIFLALLEQFKMCSKVFFLTFEEEEGMKIFSRSNMTWVYFKQAYTIHIFGGRIPTAVSAIFFRLYAHKASKQKCVYLHTSSFCNYHKYSGFFFFFSCRWILSSFENNEIVQFFLFSDQWTKVWKTTYCFLALGNKVVKIIWSLRAKRE